MKAAGIICEYNPFHNGHALHIKKTREITSSDVCIVCVMSGNFVQRGDIAVFSKHARAKSAVLCGADIVIEMPVPYALSSAREFARAGVYLLSATGICKFISFGSESGDIEILGRAADIIANDEAEGYIRQAITAGLPYAAAQQSAADAVLGSNAGIFRQPNNILAIEYLKAMKEYKTAMKPVTFTRVGGKHDGDSGYSASALRKELRAYEFGADRRGFVKARAGETAHTDLAADVLSQNMPKQAIAIYTEEIQAGRGPVYTQFIEQAILSRLRVINDFSRIQGASDGLDRRFLRASSAAPSIQAVLEMIKTKRFAMSRIRRVLMCAALGISDEHIKQPPPYIRVLAVNKRGMECLKEMKHSASLPVITKPASALQLDRRAADMFKTESAATDLYALAYPDENARTGGNEWRQSPVIIGYDNVIGRP